MQLPDGGHWHYTFKPATVPRDGVRQALGDTLASDALFLKLSDEEIFDNLEASSGSVKLAAAEIADSLAARFAREANRSVSAPGGLSTSIDLSKRGEAYAKLAKALRERAAELGEGVGATGWVHAGGISIAANNAADADTDRPQPVFRDGMFENR